MGGCGSIDNIDVISNRSESPIDGESHPSFSSNTDVDWFTLQFHDDDQSKIKKPDELGSMLTYPPKSNNENVLNHVLGSLIGLALGDALGAHVEFRPHQYLLEHPVTDLQAGGTWGLKKGQFTDDTSMALCLAISLIARQDFSAYDQLVRYKWWYRHGYMSSTGECFDIGAATSQSLREFERRQKIFADQHKISREDMDYLSDPVLLENFDIYCSDEQAAGNGGLMRLSPAPLFFHRIPSKAVKYSGISAKITHGDERVYDACRFYGALIVAAVRGETKDKLLDRNFYQNHKDWFSNKPLHEDIQKIAEGSYKKEKGYDGGIRGKGFVVNSLEAALWAFWSDGDSFEKGALAAVNLGDDADTTAAIYGQLAGAYYGYKKLPQQWVKQVYAKKFITCLSEWIVYEGQRWASKSQSTSTNSHLSSEKDSNTHSSVIPSTANLESRNHSKDEVSNKSRHHTSSSKRPTEQ